MNGLLIRTLVKYAAFFICLMFGIMTKTAGQTICVERKDKIPFTGKYIYICEGKNVGLTAKLCIAVTGKVNFRWTYLNDSFISTTNSSIAIPDTGAYEIVVTLPSGSILKDTFNIQYYKNPFFEIVTNPLPLKCEGVPLTLKSTKNTYFSNYHWFTSADTTSLSISDTLYDAQKDTTYIVTAIDKNKCIVADTFQVVQSPFVPKVNLGPRDTTLCEGSILELKNLLTDTYDHFWSTGETDNYINVLQSGKYWLRVRNTFRCTATDTINVTIVPLPKIIATKNFYSCFGSGVQIGVDLNANPSLYQYEWTPKQNIDNNRLAKPTVNPITTTRYKVKIFTSGGCGDTASVLVFINPQLKAYINTQDTTTCLGKSIGLKAYGTGGSPGSTPSFYDYSWKPATGIDFPNAQNVQAKPTVTTSYTLYVKDSRSCYDSVNVRIKISQMSVKIDATKKGDLCLGDSLALTNTITGGLAPYNYLWSSNQSLAADTTSAAISFATGKAGNLAIKLLIKDKANCVSSDSIVWNIHSLPSLAKINRTKKICVGDTVIFPLTASGGSGTGYTFPWYPSNETIRNKGTNSPVITGRTENIGFKTFYVRVTDSKACSSKLDTLTLQTVPDYQVNFGKMDTSACLGTAIILSPSELFNKGLLFSWTKNADTNPISTDSIYTIISPGKYTLGIKNPSTGCSSYGIKNVSYILPPSNPKISALEEVCANAKILFKGSAEGKELGFSWTSTGLGDFSNKTLDSSYYLPSVGEIGNIQVKLTIKNSCGQIDTSKLINILEPPSLHVSTTSSEVLVDSSIVFTALGSSSEPVTWNFGDGSPEVTGIDVVHIFQVDNTFQIFAVRKNSKGCLAKDSIKITVEQGVKIREIYVPNVFSPSSSDKDNNALKIFGKNISSENFTFRVYNKWGEVIFHTDNLVEAKEKGWNGNFLNAEQPANVGLYTYTVKGKFTDGTPIEKAGSATLLK